MAFTRQLVQMASLSGRVDASDLLVLQERIGDVPSANPGTTCATAVMKITAPSSKPNYAKKYNIIILSDSYSVS